MKIKKGDKIKVLTGKDKGKTGNVLQIFIKEKKASVEGVNLLIKHIRPRREGEKGQRVEFSAPFSLSNMMLVCPKCGKTTRINYELRKIENKETNRSKTKKMRKCKKCQQLID